MIGFFSLKDKEVITITDKSGSKPNKIWVDKGSKFYNKSLRSWLPINNIEIYSMHNEGKFAATERFVRTLKNKIYKYVNSISKNVYIDKLDSVVKKYNNTYSTTITIKPVDVKSKAYINFN